MKWLCAALLLLLALPAQAQLAVAGALTMSSDGDGVVARLALSRPPDGPFRTLALADPARLVVDIGGASTQRRDVAGAGRVRAARVAQFDPQTVRMVFDLDRPMQVAAVRLAEPRLLEIRLTPATATAFAAAARTGRQAVVLETPRAASPAEVPTEAEMAEIEALLAIEDRTRAVAAARPPRRGRPLVVIDAGHGGRDVGAISVHGRFEKDFTLAVALATER
ncbi:MAG: AMIN domain-containing protein, partial [Thermaurantiacus sp.]